MIETFNYDTKVNFVDHNSIFLSFNSFQKKDLVFTGWFIGENDFIYSKKKYKSQDLVTYIFDVNYISYPKLEFINEGCI